MDNNQTGVDPARRSLLALVNAGREPEFHGTDEFLEAAMKTVMEDEK